MLPQWPPPYRGLDMCISKPCDVFASNFFQVKPAPSLCLYLLNLVIALFILKVSSLNLKDEKLSTCKTVKSKKLHAYIRILS